MRVRGSVDGWGWAASIPKGFIGFLIDFGLNSPAALWSCGRPSFWQKWEPEVSPGKQRRPMHRADQLATFMYRLSSSPGSLNLLKL